MLTPKRSFILLLFIFISAISSGQTSTVKEYLGIKGPLSFSKKNFNLSWTSHPSATYYKQEYVETGVDPEKYKQMLMVEVLTGTATPKELVSGKMQELKTLKATNPLVNYDVISNAKTGEYILDFLISANSPNGTPIILERNVYRYMKLPVSAGGGVVLFAVSHRAYDKEIDTFLAGLKNTRNKLMTEVAAFKLPPVVIKK
jgi:hypothetical protein